MCVTRWADVVRGGGGRHAVRECERKSVGWANVARGGAVRESEKESEVR